MSKTGKLVLINGTGHHFRKIHCESFQLVRFQFPELVRSGACEICEIQWSHESFVSSWSDRADVTYQLEGTDYQFHLQARIHSGFDLYVNYANLSNLGSNFIRLEWLDATSGYMQFFLSGRDGKFVSTGSTSGANCWMSENLDLLGDRTLRELCLPASHDSGMSEIRWQSVFATASNTQTQLLSIYEQLNCGVRWFDIRPMISNGQFYTGHYAHLVGGVYQGALGQSIRQIIDQINNFSATNPELIILSISHCLNLDGLGLFDRPLHQDEFDRLCRELLAINHRFIAPSGVNLLDNLVDKPLRHFIGDRRPAVCLVLSDPNLRVDPQFGLHNGFYPKPAFNVIDQYANTNRLEVMIEDQMTKLTTYRSKKNRSRNYFLLSWTLTQQNVQTAFGQSIASMAIVANSHLFKLLSTDSAGYKNSIHYNFNRFVKDAFPNLISLDFVNTDVTALSLGINLFNTNSPPPAPFAQLKQFGLSTLTHVFVRLAERYLLVFTVFVLFNLMFYVQWLVTRSS